MKLLIIIYSFQLQHINKITTLLKTCVPYKTPSVSIKKKRQRITQTRFIRSKERFSSTSYTARVLFDLADVQHGNGFLFKLVKLVNFTNSARIKVKII